MNDILDTLEIASGDDPDHAVIWLHGLGADGHDFEPLVPILKQAGVAPTRFVFPHAPQRPVTINGGVVMRAWYDILGPDIESRADRVGLAESTAALERLIERELERGIVPERLVLAGFSQGGAVILNGGVRCRHPLGGLVALSTYLPTEGELQADANLNTGTPVFMAHGSLDPVVPIALGEQARDALLRLGFQVDWRHYAMGHQVVMDEIVAIADFLKSVQ